MFQVVGKSAKPIPVMLLGVLIGRKNYPLRRYLFVFLIVAGVIAFMFKEQTKPGSDSGSTGIGELLLVLSLTMDGLTGAVQVSLPSLKYCDLSISYIFYSTKQKYA